MPYRVNKLKKPCTQSDGDKGGWTLTYTDKKGKKHRNCHTSEKGARAQIAAIEAEADESDGNLLERALRFKIRKILIKEMQSHTFEPAIGDSVVNVNPGCKHYRSMGNVISVDNLADDAGKTVCYQCTNSGDTWDVGDVLTKTLDQVAPA